MEAKVEKTILLVEDQALIAAAETKMLQNNGYRVITVYTGEAAVEAAEASPEIEMVLMDINLGRGIDGTQAAELILARRDLPIVFLSSHTERAVVDKTEGVTSYGYIVKNSGETVLIASIKMAFRLFEARKQEQVKEEALRQNEASLRESQRVAHVGHWSWDTRTNKVTWSDEMKRIFGIDPDNFAGDLNEIIAQSIHPDDREKVNASNRAVLNEHRPAPMEYRVVWPDNSVHTIWAVPGSKVTDAHGNILLLTGIVQDITERKQIEDDLRASEEKYHKLFSEMFIGFSLQEIICDESGKPLDYITLEVNPAYEQYLSISRQAVIGRKASEFLPPDELVHWLGIFGPVALVGAPTRYESYSPLNNKHFEGLAYCPQKGQFAVMFIDVTERKQIEDSLREREARLKTVAEITPDTILQVDQNGLISYINRPMPGLTREQIIGSSIYQWVPLEQHPVLANTFEAVFTRGEPGEYDSLGPGPYGAQRNYHVRVMPVIVDGKTASAIYTATDITQYRLTQETLRETHAKLEATLNALPDLLFEVDQGRRILDYRAPDPKLLYTPPETFLGKTIFDVLPHDAAQTISDAVARAAASGLDIGATYQLPMPDGPTWFELSIAAKEKPNTPPDRFVALARDITVRKQIEQALEEAILEKQVLLKELQHRAKNSFALITSMASLTEATCQGEEAKSRLSEMTSRVMAISELYDLLYTTETVTETRLDVYCSRIVDAFQPPRGIELNQSYENITAPTAIAAPLGLILTELLTNAIKYAFPKRATGSITVSLEQAGASALLRIQDDGVGMPEGLDPTHSDTLGLMLVQLLTQQIHGSFRIEPVHGTCCVVEFPV